MDIKKKALDSISTFAASAVEKISKMQGERLDRRKTAPVIPVSPVLTASSDSGKYSVGFSSAVIMPDDIFAKKYWIAGHGIGHRAEGVHDPLTVNAMWIGVPDGAGVVLVSADLIGLTNTEVKLIRKRLSGFIKRSGCISVSISCTHTHAGLDTLGYWGMLPRSGKDPAFMEKTFSAITRTVNEAYDARKTGTLYYGTAVVPGGQSVSRPPFVKHEILSRIRFAPDDGSKETWYLNFPAHPNTLGGGNRLISADYPYFLRKKISSEKNADVLFSVGAIGAVDTGEYSDDRVVRTKIAGETLADYALKMSSEKKLDSVIRSMTQPFYYHADNSVLAFLASLNVMSSDRYPSSVSRIGIALKSEMTLLTLGSQKILMLPGENFPETVYGGYSDSAASSTGLGYEVCPPPLTEIAKDDSLLIFGVTNDMTGYVIPPNDFVLNKKQPFLNNGFDRFGVSHYHETNSLGVNSQKIIADTFSLMMDAFNKNG